MQNQEKLELYSSDQNPRSGCEKINGCWFLSEEHSDKILHPLFFRERSDANETEEVNPARIRAAKSPGGGIPKEMRQNIVSESQFS